MSKKQTFIWEEEKRIAAEKERLQAAQEAKEKAEKEAAERKHIIDNLYYLPRETDEGILGAVHQQYLNKIVFSSQAIDKNPSSDGAFKQVFNVGDEIYARAFLPQSTRNYYNEIGNPDQNKCFFLLFSIEGYDKEKMPFFDGTTELSHFKTKQATSLSIGVSPSNAYYKVTADIVFDMSDDDAFINHLKAPMYNMYFLPNGTYNIKMEIVMNIPKDDPENGIHTRLWQTKFGKQVVMASGSLQVQVDDAGKAILGKRLAPPPHTAIPLNTDIENETRKILDLVKLDEKYDYTIEKFSLDSHFEYERDKIWNRVISRTVYGIIHLRYTKTNTLAIYKTAFKQEHIDNNHFAAAFMRYCSFYDVIPNESVI